MELGTKNVAGRHSLVSYRRHGRECIRRFFRKQAYNCSSLEDTFFHPHATLQTNVHLEVSTHTYGVFADGSTDPSGLKLVFSCTSRRYERVLCQTPTRKFPSTWMPLLVPVPGLEALPAWRGEGGVTSTPTAWGMTRYDARRKHMATFAEFSLPVASTHLLEARWSSCRTTDTHRFSVLG